jgi:hypothetical protein
LSNGKILAGFLIDLRRGRVNAINQAITVMARGLSGQNYIIHIGGAHDIGTQSQVGDSGGLVCVLFGSPSGSPYASIGIIVGSAGAQTIVSDAANITRQLGVWTTLPPVVQ